MKTKMITKRAAAVTLACITLNLSARAELLFYEGFDYAGGSSLNGANGGTGFADAWDGGGYNIGGGLAAGNLTVGGGAVSGNGGSYAFRALATPVDAGSAIVTGGGSLYLSFLLYGDGKTYNNLTLFEGNDQRLGIGNLYGADDVYLFKVVNNYDASATGSPNVPGTAQLLVLQLDYSSAGHTSLNLYLNPAGKDLGAAIAWQTIDSVLSFDRVRLELPGGSIDELRLATTLAEALPGIIAVPEPSVLALLGTGAGLLVFLRRRK